MKGMRVKQAGLLSLLTDGGRFGAHGIGLTTGGPVDRMSFRWANRLVANDSHATAIEVSVGGLTLEVEQDTVFAVCGADMPLTINGETAELWRSYRVRSGDEINLGFVRAGCRAYLAVAGGFQIKPQFGSTATVCREGVGGLNGSKLEAGDILPCAPHHSEVLFEVPQSERPAFTSHLTVRVIPGYQVRQFDPLQQRRFFSHDYTVSQRSDRMGYRMEGPAIKANVDGILSEGICLGAIQIPADGQPIVLLQDRQTIGGYPKIGSVISCDIGPLTQLQPGATVAFEAVTIDRAHNLLLLQESRYQRVALHKIQVA